MAAEHALFWAVMGAEVLLGGALVLTLATGVRVWPPPGRNSWQYWFVWSLFWAALAGLIALGLVDWNGFVLDHWVRFPIGALMVAGGLLLVGWGVHTLGIRATSGLPAGLVTRGAFRYSRNPQYVGEIVWLLGYSVLVNSGLTMGAALLGCACFLLVPYTEEPWLRDRHGPAFDAYAVAVPRFVGRAVFRRR